MVTKNKLMFVAGFLSCAFIFLIIGFGTSNLEIPFVSALGYSEAIAPSDHVSEENIIIYPDRIVIMVSNASVSRYAATGSMKPVFDKGANGIRIVPESTDEINVGDIISFRKSGRLIVHRVIEKGDDNSGVYFVTKGDNNEFSDGKVRFEDIEYKTIAVIW